MKKLGIVLGVLLIVAAASGAAAAQKKSKLGKVCGDPTSVCKGSENFQPFDLPFDMGKDFVIAESEWFYAVVLESKKLADFGDCEHPSFTETRRLELQALFPHNKVFAQNCVEPGYNYYKGVADQTAFVGVYAGATKAAADAFLKTVQATQKFTGIRVRRMQIGINGT